MLVASSVAVITLLIGSVIGCERSQCRQATAFVECRKKFREQGTMSLVFEVVCGNESAVAARVAFRSDASWSSAAFIATGLQDFMRKVADVDPDHATQLVEQLISLVPAEKDGGFPRSIRAQHDRGYVRENKLRSAAALAGSLQGGIVLPMGGCEFCLDGPPINLYNAPWDLTVNKTVTKTFVSIEFMTLVNGSLSRFLDEDRIPLLDKYRLLFGILSDLAQMAHAGACHPDPHGGNIMIHGNLSYSWSDFGITSEVNTATNAQAKLIALLDKLEKTEDDATFRKVVDRARTEAETANVIDVARTATASMRDRLSLAERKKILERALPASLLVIDDMVDKELFATTVASHNKQISDQNKQISDLKTENTTHNMQISDLNKQISDQNKQISDQNKQISELRELIVRQFRRRNETGETKRLNGI